ncbi:MAG: RHS repeat domain-containing protein [Bacteroidota bacterium]
MLYKTVSTVPISSTDVFLEGDINTGDELYVGLRYINSDKKNFRGETWELTVDFKLKIDGHEIDETLRLSKTPNYDVFEDLYKYSDDINSSTNFQLLIIEKKFNVAAPHPELDSVYLIVRLKKAEDKIFQNLGAPNIRLSSENKFITWDPVVHADFYEVQWAFYDDYNIRRSIFLEPVSVIVTEPLYWLNLDYPKGHIKLKVVAIQELPMGANKGPGSNIIEIETRALDDNLNWQYTSMFIEEGKRNDAISYYDGLLNNLQKQTSSFEDSAILVSDFVYDNEGRLALEFLPTPVDEKELNYKAKFNSPTGQPNSKFVFDHFDDNLFNYEVDSKKGSGKYYSSENDFGNRLRDYIPHSEGFPYMAREYYNDNLGRIKQESIPGKISNKNINDGDGSNETVHRKKYYTSNLTSVDLIRLFGSDITNQEYYRKEISVDENNQASVQIIDHRGKQIATALLGSSPDNLDSLPSNRYDLFESIDKDLLTYDQGLSSDNSYVSVNRIFNSQINTGYNFRYELGFENEQLIAQFGEVSEEFCTDCTYELVIYLLGPDGRVVQINGEDEIRETISSSDISSCAGGGDVITINISLAEIGVYEIYKLLRVTSSQDFEQNVMLSSDRLLEDELAEIMDDYNPMDISDYSDEEDCKPCQDNVISPENGKVCTGVIEMLEEQLLGQCMDSLFGCSTPVEVAVGNSTTLGEINLNSLNDLCGFYTKSQLFDVNFLTIQSYEFAYANGYFNPLSQSYPGEGFYHFLTNPVEEDPVKDFLGTELTNQFRDRLREFFYDEELGITVSIWEFVSDPRYMLPGNYQELSDMIDKALDCDPSLENEVLEQGSVAIQNGELTNDLIWTFFKGIYQSVKRHFIIEKIQSIGCLSREQVREKFFGETIIVENEEDAINAREDFSEEYCTEYCSLKVESWANRIVDKCNIEDTTLEASIRNLLKQYCSENCDLESLVVNINAGNLDNPILFQINDLLSGVGCGLSDYIFDDPIFEYNEYCHQNCTTNLTLNKNCMRGLVNSFNDAISPSASLDSLLNNINQLQNRCSLDKSIVDINKNRNEVEIIFEDSSVCTLFFYPERITLVGGVERFMPDGTFEYKNGLTILNGTIGGKKVQLATSCDFILDKTRDCIAATKTHPCFGKLIKSMADIENTIGETTYKSSECGTISKVRGRAYQYNFTSPDGVSPLKGKDCSFSIRNSRGELVNRDKNTFGRVFRYSDSRIASPIDGQSYTGYAILKNNSRNNTRTENVGAKPKDTLYVYSSCTALKVADCYTYPSCVSFGDSIPVPEQEVDVFCDFEGDIELKEELERESLEDEHAEIIEDVKLERTFQCMEYVTETFNVTFSEREYHYTLYYYDLAGNLSQTVPPAGVYPLSTTQIDEVLDHDAIIIPDNRLQTKFTYNSYNLVVEENNPDKGKTKFLYNDGGLVRISQNARQLAEASLSFTKYDKQQRVVENGVVNNVTFTEEELTILPYINDFPSKSTHELTEVHYTLYDDLSNIPETILSSTDHPERTIIPKNLRGRVAARYVEYIEDHIDAGTLYNYDEHGFVNETMKYIDGLGHKITKYDYELASGNIKRINYQPFEGADDSFYHKYEFDKNNRLKSVYTSRDGVLWDNDANYSYYPHGPLERKEIGHDKLQGMDYIYTIKGWQKGVNSNTLSIDRDPGKDGIDNGFAADLFGYTLGYFDKDYKPVEPININSSFEASTAGSDFKENFSDLFNGNIASMVITNPDDGAYGYAFRYDQLNRIKKSDLYFNLDTDNNFWKQEDYQSNRFNSSYQYDPNGNITELNRNGGIDGAGMVMDRISYEYDVVGGKLNSNRLLNAFDDIDITDREDFYYPSDATPAGTMLEYDEMGNVTKDKSAFIEEITWHHTGKVASVIREIPATDSSPTNTIEIAFAYNENGHRQRKEVNGEVQYYVRDEQGNPLAIYNGDGEPIEFQIYGSERLGTWTENHHDGMISIDKHFYRIVNTKSYELTNHLGNVNLLISDRKEVVSNAYTLTILNTNNYYPFGTLMQNGSGNYRYGFNGMEKDNEVSRNGDSYTTEFRQYDARLGRWLAVDPLVSDFPWQSPYLSYNNNPVKLIDKNGASATIPEGAINDDEPNHSGGDPDFDWEDHDPKIIEYEGAFYGFSASDSHHSFEDDVIKVDNPNDITLTLPKKERISRLIILYADALRRGKDLESKSLVGIINAPKDLIFKTPVGALVDKIKEIPDLYNEYQDYIKAQSDLYLHIEQSKKGPKNLRLNHKDIIHELIIVEGLIGRRFYHNNPYFSR